MLFVARGQRHHELRQAGDIIDLLLDGEAGAEVVKLHGASRFSQDRERERIPFGKNLAMGDVLTVLNAQARAVNDVVALLLAALFIDDGDEAGAVHGDGGAPAALDELEVHELDHTVVARFERGAFGNASGSSTDVERAHGELRAGFTDGLRGNDADGFAELDHAAGGKVATVAESANTTAGFTGEHGTDAHAFDAGSLHLVRKLFGDFLVHVHDDRALEVLDLIERNAPNDAIAQRLDFDAGFDDGLDVNAVARAAVAFVDDHVLSNVDETAGQVAGISGLERGIGQALARAVRGDEVFQHGQAFAEVGGDGCLNDFAGRLGHQAAHSGELADLLLRSACAGVRHDVDGVDVALFVLVLEGPEHFVGDFFGDVAPDSDDLVVTLAVGDGAVEVLLLNLDAFLFGGIDKLILVARNEHVVNANGDAGLGGIGESQGLQVIEQNHGVFEPESQVGVIDELLNTLLFEETVHVGKFFRQMRIENDAADGRLNELPLNLHGLGVRDVLIVVRGDEIDDFAGEAQTDRCEQFNFAGFERENHFVGGAEDAAFALCAGLRLGQVIDTENHVLRRYGERQAMRGRQNVARAEHQHRRFDL